MATLSSHVEPSVDVVASPLCLRGGLVFDSKSGDATPADVFIDGPLVKAVGVDACTGPDVPQIDAEGLLIVPGLVDLHAHVFDGVGDSVSADAMCLGRGTVTVVDAGSAGAAAIDAFARIAKHADCDVLAWLNLSTVGLIDTRVGELVPGPYLDAEAAIRAARQHPDLVVGLKARLSTYAAGRGVRRVLDVLIAAGEELGLPVMVHVGDTDEPLEEIVAWLRPGDVVTHSLTGRKHGILDGNGRLRPGIADAQARGVVFDSARGMNHLSFEVLANALAEGFIPDTLSTDMTDAFLDTAEYSLATMATYLLAFGVPLHEVVARMTVRPAAVVGRHRPSSIAAGGAADLTLLAVRDVQGVLRDVDGREVMATQVISPVATVRAGTYRPCTPRGR